MKTYHTTIEPLESRIAPAVIIVVNNLDSGTGSLRAALALADDPSTHPGPDTIIFHLPASELVDGAFTIPVTSGELTSAGNITIAGPGAGKLIIAANHTERVLEITDGNGLTDSPATISGLTITGGNPGGNASGDGGGIFSHESLTLKNVVIAGNSGREGGGVNIDPKDASATSIKVSISNSLITGNTAGSSGGGVNASEIQTLKLSNSNISANVADADSSGGGLYAGIIPAGTGITITGCTFSGNTAGIGGGISLDSDATNPHVVVTVAFTKISGNTSTIPIGGGGGGGLYFRKGNAVVVGSTLLGNSAVYYGGGIEVRQLASLSISASTISGNQTTTGSAAGEGGGGIFILGGEVSAQLPAKITGSHITNNHTTANGGGVYAHNDVALTISGSTVAGNSAKVGGGVAALGFSADAVNLTVIGSIVSDNVGSYGGGIHIQSSGLFSITSSKLTGNVASSGGGGGIFVYGVNSATVKNTVATGNFAGTGGGLDIADVQAFNVTGGSVSGNGATVGGGIYLYQSTGSIRGVTISGNAATTLGGGVVNGASFPGVVTLQIARVFANSSPHNPNTAGAVTLV